MTGSKTPQRRLNVLYIDKFARRRYAARRTSPPRYPVQWPPHSRRRTDSRPPLLVLLAPEKRDRRKTRRVGFDIAAALEVSRRRAATKPELVMLVQRWIDAASREDLGKRHADYALALRRAFMIMLATGQSDRAIAHLRNLQKRSGD